MSARVANLAAFRVLRPYCETADLARRALLDCERSPLDAAEAMGYLGVHWADANVVLRELHGAELNPVIGPHQPPLVRRKKECDWKRRTE